MTSNNAVILLKAQTYGPVKKGETLEYKERPYEFPEPGKGEIVVKALYLSADLYMVLIRRPITRLTDRGAKSEMLQSSLILWYTPNPHSVSWPADELRSRSRSANQFTASVSASYTNPTTLNSPRVQSLIQPWIGQSIHTSRVHSRG
jgi:hypothetical protein